MNYPVIVSCFSGTLLGIFYLDLVCGLIIPVHQELTKVLILHWIITWIRCVSKNGEFKVPRMLPKNRVQMMRLGLFVAPVVEEVIFRLLPVLINSCSDYIDWYRLSHWIFVLLHIPVLSLYHMCKFSDTWHFYILSITLRLWVSHYLSHTLLMVVAKSGIIPAILLHMYWNSFTLSINSFTLSI